MSHAMKPEKRQKYFSLLGTMAKQVKPLLAKVKKYVLPEFMLISDLLFSHHLLSSMFVEMLSCMTLGICYVPCMHEDNGDCTLTILVALGDVAAGGEFAFPTLGCVLPIKPGMIWVVNASVPHCTCEMALSDSLQSRMTLALFSKTDTVRAIAKSCAYVDGNGGQHSVPSKTRKRKNA